MARPKRKHLAPAEQHVLEHLHLRVRSARGGSERLQALIFAKAPNVLDLY